MAIEQTRPDDDALDLRAERSDEIEDDADPLERLDREQGIGPYRTASS